ncbi:MAG: FeoA family protein [Candidatus Omnitrophota bacterium]
MIEEKDLTKLEPDSSGVIKEIGGGERITARLNSMGLRQGKKIKKISSHFWRGPQTVEVDGMKLAVGFGTAKKIIIQVEK